MPCRAGRNRDVGGKDYDAIRQGFIQQSQGAEAKSEDFEAAMASYAAEGDRRMHEVCPALPERACTYMVFHMFTVTAQKIIILIFQKLKYLPLDIPTPG